MTSGAQELLSILLMLPDGLTDAHLVQIKFPIVNILACKTTLIRTSLTYVDQDQHLKLSGKMLHWKSNPIFGEYLIQLLQTDYLPSLDYNSTITLGMQHFESKDPLEQARWYRALGMYFKYAKSELTRALKHFQKAHSLAESIEYPTIVGHQVLGNICSTLMLTRQLLSALKYAKEAHKYAEHMGDIYGQASSLYFQARCHEALADYQLAELLLQKSKDLLTACGLQQGILNLWILNFQVEIHLVKSEHSQSRTLQVAIASSCQPYSYSAFLANLNTALIDTATGADSKLIHQILDSSQFHLKALYGLQAREISLVNCASAELCLQDGALETANAMLDKCFASTQHNTAMALLCAERLGDHSTGMNVISTTLRWGGMKDMIKIDAKLAEVDSAFLEEYEQQLYRLSELHVPGSGPEETYVVEEKGEDKLAEDNGFGDEERQEVIV
ncbi:hypothetical protein C8J57DRAFT_1230766 [Mycena rebaudengoi]|nr:hypothetical protein C8J57DRAFT_1230766 [Mycena rebaudengoi]